MKTVAAMAVILAWTGSAAAASLPCRKSGSVEDARIRATVVFRGTVERAARDIPGCKTFLAGIRGQIFDDSDGLLLACGVKVTLRVDGVWKGDVPARVTVTHDVQRDCDPPLSPGHPYVVFATRLSGQRGLVVLEGSGTIPVAWDDAAAVMRSLGAARPPAPVDAPATVPDSPPR